MSTVTNGIDHDETIDDHPGGAPWDGATWVDVDDAGQWRPSALERTRAFVLLGLLVGFLLLAAFVAVVSWDDGGGDDGEVATRTTSPTTEAPTDAAPSTTASPSPASVDGAEPPEGCADDDREGRPLRERSEAPVNVLNGAGIGGLAGDTANSLNDAGYTTTFGNGTTSAPTVITFLEGFCAEGARLAEDLGLPGATLTAGDALGDPTGAARLEVLLGTADF